MFLTMGSFLPTFLTATVEWVEAFTIVLAVSLTIGWRAAGGAAGAALLTLAALTAITGGALQAGLNVTAIELVVGVFLLLFGTRWLAKAIARQAGLKRLHDEAEEFAETQGKLRGGTWYAAWLIAYKGVLLEGLEVWLIVVSFSLRGGWATSGAAALIALLMVCAAGLAVRAPLQRVPENAIKFLVGAMIVSFGTFWTLEALGGEGAWPLGDWTLPILAAFYLLGGLAVANGLRLRQRLRVAAAR